MSYESFIKFYERLRPCIKLPKTHLRKPIFDGKQVGITLYYLSDKG